MCDGDRSPGRSAGATSYENEDEWISTIASGEGVPTMSPDELAEFLAEVTVASNFVHQAQASEKSIGNTAMFAYARQGLE